MSNLIATSPFDGPIVVIAPHMDDETLGCGMLLAAHTCRHPAHVIFATDGAKSPAPPNPFPVRAACASAAAAERADDALSVVRETEAGQALALLGVPPSNIEFLRFPDGELRHHRRALADRIVERARALRPAYLFIPFRYDHHPDHLAVNRAVIAAEREGRLDAKLIEYFVYSRWRLLPRGDVRDYLADDAVLRFRSSEGAARKRAALTRYHSQTTRYFHWQRRPVLSAPLIERVCLEAEVFLAHDARRDGRRALARGRHWVPLACRMEPPLKRCKDWLVERLG